MTLAEFARKTGWPLDELEALPLKQAVDLFALYDLTFEVRIPAVNAWDLIQWALKGGMPDVLP